ncbi:MAG: glycosyltransferase, exosortase A system-associated [Planctomycetota bacterium]
MKILHVLDHSLPLQSGYVYRTLGILGAQRAMGWRTFHLTSPKQGQYGRPDADGQCLQEMEEGWHFFRTPQRYGSTGRLAGRGNLSSMLSTHKRLLEVIEEVQPDLVHAHSPMLNGLPAVWAGRKLGVPVVYEIRAFWEDGAVDLGKTGEKSLRYRVSRSVETKVVRQADAVFTICDGLRQDLLARGIAAEKVGLIPNAVDIERFPLLRGPDKALRAELGLEGARVLGFAGSFYQYEGLDLLIQAMPALLRSEPSTRLLLVGGGPQLQALQELVASSGLENRVIFTGRVPHSQVARYYSLFDLVVFPRRSIRLTELVTPLKPLEAMAQGIVCLASNVGGHRELIRDGETGYLCDAADAPRLAQGVERAFAAVRDWPELRKRARRFVETERNWLASARGYRAVYERLTAGIV